MEISSIELVKAFEELNILIQLLQAHSSSCFTPVSRKVKKYYNLLMLAEESSSKEEMLKLISGIVTNLQMHDILNQKLAHIRQIHKGLINELEERISAAPVQNSQYIRILPDIIKLTLAQLELVNDEFRIAISEIHKSVIQIETTLVIDMSGDSSSSFLITSKKIMDYLKHLGFYLKNSRERLSHEASLNYIEEVYTMDSEREVFYRVFKLREDAYSFEDEKDESKGTDTVEFF